MSSKDINPSQETLICLIYRHLKDNGYKKAANVLRKHAPQVETGEVKASLSEIYNKWTSDEASKRLTDDSESDSSESSDAPPWPPDVQTPELSPARTKAQSPKKPANRNIRKTSGSKKQTKKETVTKSKKRKKSGSEDGGPKSHTAAVSSTPESDSDSSLDVEKWTKLVSQLSETDIAKMEVLSNFVESPVSLPGTSTEKGKKTKQTKNEKSRTATQKTKSKTDDISVETEPTQTSSKKSKDKTTAAISKGPKRKTSKSPKRTKAKNSKAEKVEMHEPAVNHDANGLLESWKQDCQSNKSTGKSSNGQIETRGKENTETSSSQTSSKKAKKKKVDGQSEATPDNNTDNEVKKNACEPEDHSQDGDLKMASKKAKKSKSVEEPVPSETPKKVKTKKTLNPAELDSTTSEKADVLQESDPPFKEHKSDKSKSLAGAPETPSRKSKKAKSVIADPEPVETPFKTDANPTKGSSKKRRTTCNDLEMELIKSPSKSGKSQVKSGEEDEDGGGGTEESSSQDIKTPSKKRKHKEKEGNDVSASEEATPEPKKAKKKEAEEVTEDGQQPSEILTSQKKKKKKREKEMESEETAPDEPHLAVAADEVIVHKKKKKRLSRDEAPEPDTDQ